MCIFLIEVAKGRFCTRRLLTTLVTSHIAPGANDLLLRKDSETGVKCCSHSLDCFIVSRYPISLMYLYH